MEKAKRGNYNLINKTWERCKSIGRGLKSSSSSNSPARLTKKSKSWPRMAAVEDHGERRDGKKCRVAPEGCFSVYVGQEKRRFVVKTEHANHPLFKMLLEEAESEFGYDAKGPLVLPCNVDVFYRVLVEMDDSGAGDKKLPGCGFSKRHVGSYHLLSPSRMVAINRSKLID